MKTLSNDTAVHLGGALNLVRILYSYYFTQKRCGTGSNAHTSIYVPGTWQPIYLLLYVAIIIFIVDSNAALGWRIKIHTGWF